MAAGAQGRPLFESAGGATASGLPGERDEVDVDGEEG